MRGTIDVAAIPFQRLRECQVHTADLALAGFGVDDWLEAYVVAEWPTMLGRLGDRLPSATSVRLLPSDAPLDATIAGPTGENHVELSGTKREVLAWMLDRGRDPSWPTLGPW